MNRNKIIKRGASLIAVIMTAVIIIITVNHQTTESLAKESLPGVETIVANNGSNNPYIILEVVPDKANSSLGYLVGGEEPIKDGKALNDFPSKEIRTSLMTNFSVSSNFCASIFGASETDYPLNFDGTTYEETGNASKTFDLKGSFEEDSDGDYVCIFHDAQYSYVSDNSVPDTTYYEKYTEFRNLASTDNRYQITLSKVDDTDRKFTTTDIVGDFIAGTDYPTVNKYLLNQKWPDPEQGTVSQNQILVGYEGKTVYVASSTDDDATYEYFGTIEKTSVTVSANEISNIDCIHTFDDKYLVFDEALVYDSLMVDTDSLVTEMVDEDEISNMRIFDLEEDDDGGECYVSSVKLINEANSYGYVSSNEYIVKPSGHYINLTEDSVEYRTYEESTDAGLTRYNWISNYAYSSVATVKYQGGFTNHEWLKQYVFDRTKEECSSLVIDVQTVTMEELNDYDLSKVSMIYFAGGAYSVDISKAQVINLSKQIDNSNLPIIFNRSIYINATNATTLRPNLEKLGVILMQSTISNVKSSELDSKWSDATYWSQLIPKMKQANTTDGLNYVNQSIYIYDDTDYNTADSITAIPFVDRDFLTKFSTGKITSGFQVVADEIANENFFLNVAGKTERISTDISKASAFRYIINYGNQRNVIKTKISVLEIEPCNNKKTTNEDLKLETYYSDDELKNVRTSATTSMRVDNIIGHELLSKEKIANEWAEQFKEADKIDNITLTRTYSSEFIGKIEDLNETYDLIYMGLDTATMNTELTNCYHWENKYSGEIVSGSWDPWDTWNYNKIYLPPYYRKAGSVEKTTKTVFNDKNMYGLVYFHVGDVLYAYNTKLWGLLDPTSLWNEQHSTDYMNYRMSGNDITLDKYNDLVEFMNAGYPIVFADDFYTKGTDGNYSVNTYKIDKSSYMYKVAQYALDHTMAGNVMLGENVFTETMLDDNDKLKKLADYLNLSKLTVTSTYVPETYNLADGSTQYLTQTDGQYILRYDVALKNDAAVSISDTKYDCKLYIDKSVDGRYSSDEEIGGLTIYELRNGIYEEIYLNTNGKYELTAGRYYKIIRAVPDGYVGVLPWKLVFSQNDNSLVRKSISEYTAVPIPASSRVTIDVLQLVDKDQNNLDLNSDKVNELLGQVQDFNIIITKMTTQQYTNLETENALKNNFSISKYYNKLSQYDMIILGFKDSYSIEAGGNFQNEAAVWAVRQYITEGKSVLFTHDLVNYKYCDKDINNNKINGANGFWFNIFVRDCVGMDRYGVMRKFEINQYRIIPQENKDKVNIDFTFLPTIYDTAWKPGVLKEAKDAVQGDTYNTIQGFSDFLLLWDTYLDEDNKGSIYPFTSRPGDYATSGFYNNTDQIYVSKVNEGQITEYPFKIPETFQVANTHAQWLQLNLDTDSRDKYTNDDIVVWYCISNAKIKGNDVDDFYQASLNNVRNNYYIYNRGNVTYSGVGHFSVGSEDEIKLFINTMVAAYGAGTASPRVIYKENSVDTAATIDKIYVPFDTSISGNESTTKSFLDNKVDIYFDVVDTNMKSGTKTINTKYYIKVANASEGVPVSVNGEDIFLKEFIPSSVKEVSTNQPIADIHEVQDDTRYSFELNQGFLDFTSKNSAEIYIGTEITFKKTEDAEPEKSKTGYYKIEVVCLELFDLE